MMLKLSRVLMMLGVAVVAAGAAPMTYADELPHLVCLECRDISDHPEDARNFSLNLMFGRESSLGFDNTKFNLSDRFGNTITVDINARFILNPYDFRLFDELFVEDILLQVVLAYPNGDVLTYKFTRNLLDPDGALPVPAEAPLLPPTSPAESLPSGSGGSGDQEDDWDFRDEDRADWEEAWGGWHCRPDFSHPYATGVICQQG